MMMSGSALGSPTIPPSLQSGQLPDEQGYASLATG